MTNDIEWVENPANATRVADSLRDMGYDFNMAVADIVDNSIAAGASRVNLWLDLNVKGEPVFSVADDGCGMDRSGLLNALRYGSDEREDPASLGRFGMGLNTASTAFAQRVVVTSRKGADDELVSAILDLSAPGRGLQWPTGIRNPPARVDVDLFGAIADGGSGTVVRWERVDRLQKDYQDPNGAHARRAMDSRRESLRRHLQMVFQRFLDETDERARNVKIKLNNLELVAWDPFAEATVGDLVSDIKVDVEVAKDEFVPFAIRAFILPRAEEIHPPSLQKTIAVGNELQGIYVYREHRLIHNPSWLGLYSKEPHGSLLRVELSFNHLLDRTFDVDIKKSRITLSPKLRDFLKEQVLNGPRREADKRYRKGQAKKGRSNAAGLHSASNSTIAGKEAAISTAVVESVDEKAGSAIVSNPFGSIQIRQVAPISPGQVHVQSAETIDDGLLYEPAIIGTHQGVRINASHPYYFKVYLPNQDSTAAIQGLDTLFWALSMAETKSTSNETKNLFKTDSL